MVKGQDQTGGDRHDRTQTRGIAGAAFLPRAVLAQDALKVAGIYTVPVEQQWAGRIHQAAEAAKAAGAVDYVFTENVANTDYPRVMREYAESGVKLIVGEIFGAEAEAREVAAEYPDVAFLLGSSFPPDAAANPNLSPEWPDSVSIPGWTTYSMDQIIACKGPGE